jgi:hypothetical protein
VDSKIETGRLTEDAMLITNSEVTRRMSGFGCSGRENTPDQGKCARQPNPDSSTDI